MKNLKQIISKTGLTSILCTSLSAIAQQHVDPLPEAPRPKMPDNGITKQAGAGSGESFARAGVLELGGAASFTGASRFSQFSLAPSVGWFFMDNWQITGSVIWTTVKSAGLPSSSIFSLLAEPSFHLPFSNSNFGFLGLGFGVSTQTTANVGFAMAPRLGFKTFVGRSGMLTIDIRETFATNDVIATPYGTALTVSSAVAMGVGYTVLW